MVVAAVVGDNSTDTEEDARWTLVLRAPDEHRWVGGWHPHRQRRLERRHRDKDDERDRTNGDTRLHAGFQCFFVCEHPRN